MARLWKGAPVAAALSERVAAQVERLKQRGVSPALAIVRVGQRPEDLSYERGALKRCEMVGITVKQFILPDTVELTELLHIVEAINQDAAIHGCLLFRPLPRHLDEAAVCAALAPSKDVDRRFPGRSVCWQRQRLSPLYCTGLPGDPGLLRL